MTQCVWIGAVVVAMGIAAPVAGQDPASLERQEGAVVVRRVLAAQEGSQEAKQVRETMLVALDGKAQVTGEVLAKIAVEGRTTKGAPYSAEATTESTQTLADGNRIVRKSTARIYRDGEGRTRREEVNESGVVVSVSIVDPVAGTSVTLQPETRTAYRNPGGVFVETLSVMPKIVAEGRAGGGGGRGGVMYRTAAPEAAGEPAAVEEARKKVEMEQKRVVEEQAAKDAGLVRTVPRARGGVISTVEVGMTAREDLGSQNIDGAPARGSRSTTTIAAGAIGNEQPIKVVSEQWFAPDLQVLVLTKYSDPRQGETTYRLSNVVRAEPDRSLFTVPPDYTLKESGIRHPLE